jgi:diaminohydroxyphosphoribosylaminopyrimidine deaminase/5-amino-6-(5-phosphoribosylamino)uracil reductase
VASLTDADYMAEALELSRQGRRRTSPNPWVGCLIVTPDGEVVGRGVTTPPPGPHAEAVALKAAGPRAQGATAFVTLEPCSHHGRTPPCALALVDAGIARVVISVLDPDRLVTGGGLAALRLAQVQTEVGLLKSETEEELAPYLTHRRTGRPYVVCKLASTLDGKIAAADGSSRWITSAEARRDVHELRADSDAVIVGAGTVRTDDPELTVRLGEGEVRQPLRVVLGRAHDGARIHPALELSGDLGGVLDELGRRGILQLLVEGGAVVAGEFHRRGLVNRYTIYLAPAIAGGDDGVAMFAGPGAPTMEAVWRGEISSVRQIGPDLRIDVLPLDNPQGL